MTTATKTKTKTKMQIESVDIDTLRPDPANPRKISDEEMEALTRSIKEFGFVQPVLARREDGVVIAGHQRLLAARRLGIKQVPVILLDLTVEQARLLNIALNQIEGDFDNELLARMLADLKPIDGIDLTLSGFAEDELDKLMKSLDVREKRERVESFDLDAALEAARAATRAQRGQLWAMDDHRLYVGDATDVGDVARLLGEVRPSMVFCDPPYGVSLGDHGGQQRGQRRRRIANDALPAEEWSAFIRGWSRNLVANVDGAIYCCMSTKEWASVSRALAEAGGHWSDTIIWKKDRFVIGRADYQRQYEPIWYGWREGAKHQWCGDRDQGDVWEIARPSESEAAPTMKPLALVERAINNSSRPGDIVLDLFLGSGTTLIASERTGRVCYGMELDPHYASVVLARYESFSGKEAVCLGSS
ncbi:MAG: site-specific DNA-methyltransferase [Chloroflexota bacterium]|nr:site-specific DNA-methyltransferase [Chloroflexota bacterium]